MTSCDAKSSVSSEVSSLFVEIFRYRLAVLICVIGVIIGVYLMNMGLSIVGIGMIVLSLVMC